MESLQLGNRDEDDDRLLATPDINFTGGGNLEGSKLSLELGNTVLQVDQSLSDGSLSLIGSSVGCVGGAEDLVLNGHLET